MTKTVDRPVNFDNSNVATLPSRVQSVYDLDKTLSKQILDYVNAHSWRKLARDVSAYVRAQYKPAYRLVAEGSISPDALEGEIKSYLPSRSYIEAFAKGRPICYRYTNTLANFFHQPYEFKNFDPCSQYLVKLDDGTAGNTQRPQEK